MGFFFLPGRFFLGGAVGNFDGSFGPLGEG
jgi:hypothetical protein